MWTASIATGALDFFVGRAGSTAGGATCTITGSEGMPPLMKTMATPSASIAITHCPKRRPTCARCQTMSVPRGMLPATFNAWTEAIFDDLNDGVVESALSDRVDDGKAIDHPSAAAEHHLLIDHRVIPRA